MPNKNDFLVFNFAGVEVLIRQVMREHEEKSHGVSKPEPKPDEVLIKQPHVGGTYMWDGIGAGGELCKPEEVTIVTDDKAPMSNLLILNKRGDFYWTSSKHLSPLPQEPPLKPEDWVGKIADVRVTAEEDTEGTISIFYRFEGTLQVETYIGRRMHGVARAICMKFNIPIKPWTLVQKEG